VELASDINYIIMDYLVSEGYPSAAKRFSIEAGIQPQEDIASITERVEIRNAIHQGNIQRAIEKINDLGYQVSLLSNNSLGLFFLPVPCLNASLVMVFFYLFFTRFCYD
jgi:hypothetical protein